MKKYGFLIGITLVGFLLRVYELGYTFNSLDNGAMAYLATIEGGWSWVYSGAKYGVIINILYKLYSLPLGFFPMFVDEFWWRFPIALIGTIQIPVLYWVLRRLSASNTTSILGAGIIAVLPIHVFQSRYLWGYEVIGLLFVLLAITFILVSLERGVVQSRIAALLTFVYVLSHGYIIPFYPLIAIICLVYGSGALKKPIQRAFNGLDSLQRHSIVSALILGTVLATPALLHTFGKGDHVEGGVFVIHYIFEVVKNIGAPFVLLILVSVPLFMWHILRGGVSQKDARRIFIFFSAGVLYILPFLFVQPGATVSRGYLLIGPVCLLIASLLTLDVVGYMKKVTVVILSFFIVATGWGTFESFALADTSLDPTFVESERGTVEESGAKAFGYLCRTFDFGRHSIVFLHPSLEYPVVHYYCGDLSENFLVEHDMNEGRVQQLYDHYSSTIDVVVILPDQQFDTLKNRYPFQYSLTEKSNVKMIIASKKRLPELEEIDLEIKSLNRAFDMNFKKDIALQIRQNFF